MSTTRIVTLFGEEVTPESQKPAAAKGRARKKDQEAQEDTNAEENPSGAATDALAEPPTEEAATEPAIAPIAEESMPATIAAAPMEPPTEAETPIIAEPVAEETTTVPEAGAAPPAAITEPETAPTPAAKPPVIDRRKLLAAIRQTEPKVAAAKAAQPAKEPRKAKAPKAEDENKEAPAIIPEDWAGDKKYYTIGEVAGLFSVKTSHIRFWTNEFKLKVRTTRKGDRLYTPEQVKELRAIYHLVKERGFTLSGAKSKLKTENRRDITTIDLKDSLIVLREKLQILRDRL